MMAKKSCRYIYCIYIYYISSTWDWMGLVLDLPSIIDPIKKINKMHGSVDILILWIRHGNFFDLPNVVRIAEV